MSYTTIAGLCIRAQEQAAEYYRASRRTREHGVDLQLAELQQSWAARAAKDAREIHDLMTSAWAAR